MDLHFRLDLVSPLELTCDATGSHGGIRRHPTGLPMISRCVPGHPTGYRVRYRLFLLTTTSNHTHSRDPAGFPTKGFLTGSPVRRSTTYPTDRHGSSLGTIPLWEVTTSRDTPGDAATFPRPLSQLEFHKLSPNGRGFVSGLWFTVAPAPTTRTSTLLNPELYLSLKNNERCLLYNSQHTTYIKIHYLRGTVRGYEMRWNDKRITSSH